MNNFILTKNREAAVQFLVLEYLTENFKEINITPERLFVNLKMEFSIYDEKQQEKMTTKYRKIIEKHYSDYILSGKRIDVKIIKKENKRIFLVNADNKKFILDIRLTDGILNIQRVEIP